jgi:cell division protein FtsQ
MATVTIDPRLRARRSTVLREAGRRRLRRLLVVVGVVGIGATAWALSHSSMVDIDRVEVLGLDRLSLSTAEQAMGVSVGDDMLWLDMDEIASGLVALPWVHSVELQRRWPGALRVTVVERTAVALALSEANMWVQVDGEGRVLTEASSNPPHLPRLSGLHGAGAPGSFLAEDAAAPLAVVPVLPPELLIEVQGLWRDDRGEMHVSMVTGEEIILGDDLDLRAKVAAMLTMWGTLDAENRTSWILDVSVPNLPVVVDPAGEPARREQAIALGLLTLEDSSTEDRSTDEIAADSETIDVTGQEEAPVAEVSQ